MGAADPTRHARLDAAARARARDALAGAFADYPLVVELFPRGRRRAAALAWYAGYALRYCDAHGEVWTSGAPDGVAAFLKSDHTFTRRRLLAAGYLLGPLRMGLRSFRRLMRNESFMADIRHRCAPPGSWYLWMLGVAPGAQRRGVGSGLLDQVLTAAAADSAGCYLETHHRGNVAFYAAHGFETLAEGRVPASGLPFWAMAHGSGSASPAPSPAGIPVAHPLPESMIAGVDSRDRRP